MTHEVIALRTAAQQAPEALEDLRVWRAKQSMDVTAIRAALAQQAEPVAERAFLERILAAMEGVIDVADRKTAEFDALRSCVIDLTVMLHTALAQQEEPKTLDEALTLPRAMAQAYEAGYNAGVAHEREACAKLAESTICNTHLPTGVRIYGTRVAYAIRARENT